MDNPENDQEQTPKESSENQNLNNLDNNQSATPPPVESQTGEPTPPSVATPVTPPQSSKRSKKPLVILLVIILLIAGAIGAWYFLGSNGTKEDVQTVNDTKQQDKDTEKPFNNVLYYAYKEGNKQYIRSVDLNDAQAQKKTLVEFEKNNLYFKDEPDGIFRGDYAPVSISQDGKTVLYSTDKGLYEHNLATDVRKAIFKYEWKTDFVGDKILSKVIVVESGEDLRKDATDTEFRILRTPVYSPVENAIGFAEGDYEGGRVEIFDRTSNLLVDIGDTFTYIGEAPPGGLSFKIDNEAKEVVEYGLHPRELFESTGGTFASAVFNSTRSNVAATVYEYNPSLVSTDYESTTLVILDATDGTHKTVGKMGKYTFELAYQSGGTLSVIDTDGKSFVLRQFDSDRKEINAKDLSKVSGVPGEVVDADLQIINDKIYVEITTGKDGKYRTYIYNYDEDKVITDFLVAEDSDVKVLKHE